MKWIKLTIETTTEATDMLSYYLSEYGVEGIEVEDKIPLSEADKKEMFIDILPELPPDDGVAYISCYIDDSETSGEVYKEADVSKPDTVEAVAEDNAAVKYPGNKGIDIKELCKYIREQLNDMSSYMDVGTGRISIGETEDKDWLNNWKEFFHPFRLEDNIVIQPTWTERLESEPDDIVINIDPGTAFGTGSHETTRLCISGMKRYIDESLDVRVLDVGCGSGILSIIAAKLGASMVQGVDIDELAVNASIDNMRLNGVNEKQYRIVKGDVLEDSDFREVLLADGGYDVIVANILADVIIPLSGIIRQFMNEGGVFISSGIIDTKEAEVAKALEVNGFTIINITHMGEWVSIEAK